MPQPANTLTMDEETYYLLVKAIKESRRKEFKRLRYEGKPNLKMLHAAAGDRLVSKHG